VNMITTLLLIFSLFYFISKPVQHSEYRNWIAPKQLPKPPFKEIMINGILFRIPEPVNNNWNARCFGTDLPCLYTPDKRLKPRGKNIGAGFRLEK